jgi:hypothetical protein
MGEEQGKGGWEKESHSIIKGTKTNSDSTLFFIKRDGKMPRMFQSL